MKIKFDLAIDDLVAFAEYHARHTPAVKRSRLIALCIVLLPFVLIPPYVVPPEYRVVALATGIAVAILLAVRARGQYARATERQVRRLYGNGAFEASFGPCELELTATHLIKRSAASESATRLGALGRVTVTDNYTFIYASPVTAFVIPRHAVTAGDFDGFSEAIARRVVEAK